MTNLEVETAAKELAKRQGLTWAKLSPTKRIDLFESIIRDERTTVHFPMWVKVTPCATRTNKFVFRKHPISTPHGAVSILRVTAVSR